MAVQSESQMRLPRFLHAVALIASARTWRLWGFLAVALLLCFGPAGAARAQPAAVPARLTPLPSASLVTLPGTPALRALDSLAIPAAVLRRWQPPASWQLDVVGKLNASQASYRNWTEGGLNTLALTTTLQGEALRQAEDWQQSYAANLALGFLQQDTLTIRKADDRLHLSGSLQYRGNGFFKTFNPTLAANLRTQFLTGFNYDKNPFPDERDLPVEVSGFLAPATFTQSVGLTYQPDPWIAQRLSLGAKEVVVIEADVRPLYDLAPHDGMRYEAGLESTTELDHMFFGEVHVQSSLRLFAAFNREDAPDMIWENLVSLKFNEWLSVDFELAALYDGDVTQALQMRQVASLGASVVML